MSRQTLDTTYADLRPSDLVIDKTGQAWPLKELDESGGKVWFWLCDPVSKMKAHFIGKPSLDAVKVSRLHTQADEATKLESEFPDSGEVKPTEAEMDAHEIEKYGRVVSKDDTIATMAEAVAAAEQLFLVDTETGEACSTDGINLCTVSKSQTSHRHRDGRKPLEMAEAVAAVEEIGGTVEAEVTAEEVDAAAAATNDSPLTLPPFADMTPLEARSHLYLLHGVYGHDLVSKVELTALHDEAHATPPQSRFVPHSHGVKA